MAGSAVRGLMLPKPVTFVTGNPKKLEEVKAILGQTIPFQSVKLDCNFCFPEIPTSLSLELFFSSFYFIKFLFKLNAVPELQGEPEDISKEKARLAAIQVCKSLFLFILISGYE